MSVEVFVDCFDGLDGHFWVAGSGRRRVAYQARTQFGWVLARACARKAVVKDVLCAVAFVRQLYVYRD